MTYKELYQKLVQSKRNIVKDSGDFYWHKGKVKLSNGDIVLAWMLLDHGSSGEHWDTVFFFKSEKKLYCIAQSLFSSDLLSETTKGFIKRVKEGYQYWISEPYDGDIHIDKNGWVSQPVY